MGEVEQHVCLIILKVPVCLCLCSGANWCGVAQQSCVSACLPCDAFVWLWVWVWVWVWVRVRGVSVCVGGYWCVGGRGGGCACVDVWAGVFCVGVGACGWLRGWGCC